MSDAEIVPVLTALDVIFRLRERARDAMAECLRKELNPPINATITVMLEGLECIATVLSNGWIAGWDPLDMVQPLVQPLLHALSTVRNMAAHQTHEKPHAEARTIKIRDI
jgi:hypothetical protein